MHQKNLYHARKMMMLIVKWKDQKKDIYIYISPEERLQIIDELRLV